jgi:hypothetical protein
MGVRNAAKGSAKHTIRAKTEAIILMTNPPHVLQIIGVVPNTEDLV